ncbi:MAG: hypothetical protein Q4G50_08460 [Corynebacterium sp.]|uniref:hypothetical protein n=1 Tax=Corynebacterium sp. TaxID=1720 RepID=UPI0026E08289|nr:hypothetical protein [Corynebacterium sp.]MDO5670020.1 hypothetical protein [Corynebacterium sp.]
MSTRFVLLGGFLVQVLLLLALAGESGRGIGLAAVIACVSSLAICVYLFLRPTAVLAQFCGLVAGTAGVAAAGMLASHGFTHPYFWARFPHPLWVYLPALSGLLFLLAALTAGRRA